MRNGRAIRCRHHPRKRVNQYSATFVFNFNRSAILARPVLALEKARLPGDDAVPVVALS